MLSSVIPWKENILTQLQCRSMGLQTCYKRDHLYAAVLQSNAKLWKQSGFITVLDKNFKVVSNLAGTEPVYNNGALAEMQQTDAVFQYPHDVCIDDDQNMYVAQWNSGNVYPYKLTPVV